MKIFLTGAFLLNCVVFECMGGFGPGTRLKAPKIPYGFFFDRTDIIKKSLTFERLYRIIQEQNEKKRITTYSFPRLPHTDISIFHIDEDETLRYKCITIKKEPVEKLIGLSFNKNGEKLNPFNADITCDGQQQFFVDNGLDHTYPTIAKNLEKGDSLLCVQGDKIVRKKIFHKYSIVNNNYVFVPQSSERINILVSKYGVIAPVQQEKKSKEQMLMKIVREEVSKWGSGVNF